MALVHHRTALEALMHANAHDAQGVARAAEHLRVALWHAQQSAVRVEAAVCELRRATSGGDAGARGAVRESGKRRRCATAWAQRVVGASIVREEAQVVVAMELD